MEDTAGDQGDRSGAHDTRLGRDALTSLLMVALVLVVLGSYGWLIWQTGHCR